MGVVCEQSHIMLQDDERHASHSWTFATGLTPVLALPGRSSSGSSTRVCLCRIWNMVNVEPFATPTTASGTPSYQAKCQESSPDTAAPVSGRYTYAPCERICALHGDTGQTASEATICLSFAGNEGMDPPIVPTQCPYSSPSYRFLRSLRTRAKCRGQLT